MTTEVNNRGWTVFGRKHHRAVWVDEYIEGWQAACGTAWLDQTEFYHNGKATGVLVPLDLKACKNKACR